jgi:hypothetical protein
MLTNARTVVRGTFDTCRFRGPAKRQRASGHPMTVGFSRHGRTKRMMGWKMMRWKKRRPYLHAEDRAWRSFFPPSPGYPSLGCTPAEPNSVSPGNVHHTSSSGSWHPNDKREGKLRKTRLPKTCVRHQNQQNPITGSGDLAVARGAQCCRICRPKN